MEQTKSKLDADHLLELIMENRIKLDNCTKHSFGDFNQVPKDQQKFGQFSKIKLVCTNCGGHMKLTDINSYGHGYRAAGGNPDDVLTNFFGKPLTKPENQS